MSRTQASPSRNERTTVSDAPENIMSVSDAFNLTSNNQCSESAATR